MTTATAKAPKSATVAVNPATFSQLVDDIAASCLERDEHARGIVLAMLAKTNVFLLGVPGVGKSMVVEQTLRRITGSQGFDVLMTKFTTPDEVLGPINLQAFEQGRMERVMAGMLPDAHIGFLDEIFKANSAILNALLTIMNERRVSVGGKWTKVPTFCIVGASNELPQGEDLAALYDRFVIRFDVPALQAEANVRLLLGSSSTPPTPKVTLTVDEVMAAQAEVAAVTLSSDAIDAALKIRLELLGQHGIRPSDRRWKQSMTVARAEAWLAGRAEVQREDLAPLCHCLWNEKGERAKVRTVVYDQALPGLSKVMEFLDMAVEQQGIAASARDKKARMEASMKLRELEEEAAKAVGPSSSSKVKDALAKITNIKNVVGKQVLGL